MFCMSTKVILLVPSLTAHDVSCSQGFKQSVTSPAHIVNQSTNTTLSVINQSSEDGSREQNAPHMQTGSAPCPPSIINSFPLLVQFKEDGAVSVISVKNIVEPSVANLKIFSNCEVRWSDRKTYQATDQEKENTPSIENRSTSKRKQTDNTSPPTKRRTDKKKVTPSKYNYKQVSMCLLT